MFQHEQQKKKVLIQEIGETQDTMEIEGDEEGGQYSQQDQGLEKLNPQLDSQHNKDNKHRSKDLLRLEKNYFDKVYNEETYGNQKAFVVSKMMQQAPVKPDFTSLPVSCMKDRLNAFLPSFKKDTEDLLANPSRQDAMRLDDRNQYELENKQEGNLPSSDDDDRDFDEEDVSKKDNLKDSNQLSQQSKTIQLDLLLGVLDGNMHEAAETKQ